MNCSHFKTRIEHSSGYSTIFGHLNYTYNINVRFPRAFHDEPTTPVLYIYSWHPNIICINAQCTADQSNYGETYVKNIGIFVKIMQELYLQNPDLFEKMVEDYYAIKETVHEKTQQVYHDIIDGVYDQTTPVIK
jgi:hypothetical protein